MEQGTNHEYTQLHLLIWQTLKIELLAKYLLIRRAASKWQAFLGWKGLQRVMLTQNSAAVKEAQECWKFALWELKIEKRIDLSREARGTTNLATSKKMKEATDVIEKFNNF